MPEAVVSDSARRHLSDKQALRARIAARMAAHPQLRSPEEGRTAAARILSDARCLAASRIGLFAPLPDEPDSRPIFDALAHLGREILMPRCRNGTTLEFARVAEWHELEVGRYGVLEPQGLAVADPWTEGDVVIEPGVAFDLDGGRLGRGRGYYDRAFLNLPPGAPWLLGFGFNFQVVDRVPMGELDRSVDGILTTSNLNWRSCGEAPGLRS